ncbi:unnamed protein product [Arabis nemorensis]|uniref:FKB95-like N-terminal Kelch domain-containing protein n=1 Tax=Arabis nemorensis TaxID=586526 RepID=A0A565AMH9_9BRAS|nr:unnamed protein product [Arabis nemorensis]
MPKSVIDPILNVVDGKIYVIGGRYSRDKNLGVWSSNKMMVLDTEAKTWECDMSSGFEAGRRMISSVSMEDKIYFKGSENNSFVFDPKESKWEEEVDADELVQYSSWRWENGCVIDGILYSFDSGGECCLRAYDIKQRLFCGVVKGVEGLVKPCNKVSVASFGKI